MYQIRKKFGPYPAAHKQHLHKGHCRLVHGHNWTFEIKLQSTAVDQNGFVYDFGEFKALKATFEQVFDHTFLINSADTDAVKWILSRADKDKETVEYLCNPCPEAGLELTLQDFDIHTVSGGPFPMRAVIVPSGSAELIANFVWGITARYFQVLSRKFNSGLSFVPQMVEVTVYEDDKNCATFISGVDSE